MITGQEEGIVTFGHTEQPIIIFPTLFTPKKYKDKTGAEVGKEKYSASFLFENDSDELARLKKEVMKVAHAKWPDLDVNAAVKAKTFSTPFTNGAKLQKQAEKKKKDGSFYKGRTMLKSSTEFKIPVLDARQDPPVETFNEKLVYSGCYVAGEVKFNAYNGDDDDDGNATPGGVNAYLNCVVFVEKGTRIAGKDHAAAFRGIKGSASKEDPTAGGDDDEIEI